MATVLITGGNRGLGFEFARQYVADGWQVFAACRNPASAGELQRLAKDSSGKLTVVAMDVTDAASIRMAAAQLGDVAIDLVVNSAGITGVSGQRAGNVVVGRFLSDLWFQRWGSQSRKPVAALPSSPEG
jgi:NAD(P)-dependent dehydrogenase (short-subunit alcohol dehydrogenase family)